MGTVVIFAVIAAAELAAHLWAAFVAVQLWGWFAIPLGAPTVPVVAAWGLMVLLSMLGARVSVAEELAREEHKKKYAIGVIKNWALVPLVTWGFSAIIHAMM